MAPNTEVVVIHDAVRPFVSSEILGEIVMAAYTYGVGILPGLLKIAVYSP